LARLRQRHEEDLLEAGVKTRELQVKEATLALHAAESAITGAQLRKSYYERLLLTFVSPAEAAKETLSLAASGLQVAAGLNELIAAPLHLMPPTQVRGGGEAGVPKATGDAKVGTTWGPDQMARALSTTSSAMTVMSNVLRIGADLAGTFANYERRYQEWLHQQELAANDLAQANTQRDAAQKRLDIAQAELDNHRLQQEHSREIAQFYLDKHGTQELFDWMAAELGELSFEMWRLALDVAREAECAWQYECLRSDSPIRTDQWQDGYHGLLAAQCLEQDLRRMERAWHEANLRDNPIERRIPLSELDPVELVRLREAGWCEINLPEAFFDRERPGEYWRRIRDVRLSLPCVTGPYTAVNASLRLVESNVRLSDGPLPLSPPMRVDGLVPVRELATSLAVDAHGAPDWYPRDERYAAFEGAGAASRWLLELPKELNRFDTSAISDVVLDLRYTARVSDKPEFREAAFAASCPDRNGALSPRPEPPTAPPPASERDRRTPRMLSVRTSFPDVWQRLAHATGECATFVVPIGRDHLGYIAPASDVSIGRVRLVAVADFDEIAEWTVELRVGDAAANVPAGDVHFKRWRDAKLDDLGEASWQLDEPLAPDTTLGLSFALSQDSAAPDLGVLRDLLLFVAWNEET
jgi:hypothetical protein